MIKKNYFSPVATIYLEIIENSLCEDSTSAVLEDVGREYYEW